MKFHLIIIVLTFSCNLVFAQEKAVYNAVKNSNVNDTEIRSTANSLWSGYSIGINYGITQFDGDIRQYDYTSSFKESRSAYSFSLEKKINDKISISIENVSGEFAGLRKSYVGYEIFDPYSLTLGSEIPGYGDKFVTSFNETDVLLNYNLNSSISKLIKKEISENLSIIVKIGFGYNVFRSLRTNLYTDDYIYSYGYDDLTKNESKEAVSESVIVYGAKIKYEIQDGLSLLVDWTVRNSMSDKWDSSIMDGGHGNDRFSLFSFGLAYEIPVKDNTKD